MKVKLVFLATIVFFIFAGCDKPCEDCNTTIGDYSRGVFIVNEGPFGGTGTISWYNPETQEFRDSIYEKANSGASLGQFVQSLSFHNGKGYIVVNGANRIVVVDGETFQYLDTIGGLALPRYFQPVSNNTAFVTQWGADGLSGSVAQIDLDFNRVAKTYPTGKGPEKMLYFPQNKQLFIANSGGFGVDSTITFFQWDDANSFQTRVVPGQKNPACLSRNNTLGGYTPWHVLCKGDWMDANSQGWIGRLFETPITGVAIPKGSDDLATGPDGLDYFSTGSAVFQVGLDGSATKLFNAAIYGFNVHPVNGYYYCADPKDFNSNGVLTILRKDLSIESIFNVGIAPGEIVFR